MLQLSHHGRPNASVAAGAAARYCSAARIALSAHMHAALSRVCIVLGQVPDDWLLKPVSADLQIYTDSHANLFDNAKTTVQLGRWQVGAVGDDVLVAVKRTKRPIDGREEQRALREKKALQTLQHPNIVKCFGPCRCEQVEETKRDSTGKPSQNNRSLTHATAVFAQAMRRTTTGSTSRSSPSSDRCSQAKRQNRSRSNTW